MSRILIVDDEESIRHALKQVFEYEGHEVATAADGPEALELFESAGAKVDGETKIVKLPPYLVEEAIRWCDAAVAPWCRRSDRGRWSGPPWSTFSEKSCEPYCCIRTVLAQKIHAPGCLSDALRLNPPPA